MRPERLELAARWAEALDRLDAIVWLFFVLTGIGVVLASVFWALGAVRSSLRMRRLRASSPVSPTISSLPLLETSDLVPLAPPPRRFPWRLLGIAAVLLVVLAFVLLRTDTFPILRAGALGLLEHLTHLRAAS